MHRNDLTIIKPEGDDQQILHFAFEHWKRDHRIEYLFRDENGVQYIVNRPEYSIASGHKLEYHFKVKAWHLSIERLKELYEYDADSGIIKKR